MNIFQNHHKILNIFFILNIFYLPFKSEDIINNPILISESINPIFIKATSGSLYIYTSGALITIKSTGEKTITTFPSYGFPYIWLADEGNNYYIYSYTNIYNVKLGNTYSTYTRPSITFTDSTKYVGYMSEAEYSRYYASNCICSMEKEEIIIYGRYQQRYIVFSFLKKPVSYPVLVSSSTSMEEKISCKIIDRGQYLCAFAYGYVIHVYLFSLHFQSFSGCEMKSSLHSELNEQFYKHTTVEIYDTGTKTVKLICAKNIDTMYLECLKYTISVSNTPVSFWACQQTQSGEATDIILRIPMDSSSREECAFKTFASENLFCCGGNNFIRCARVTSDLNLIATFDLEFPGLNTKVNFYTDKTTYVNLLFWNKNGNDNYIYEYYFYIPTCQNLNYTIIVYHSLNEAKAENEKDNLSDLFERKTNTKYYFSFDELPDTYGDILINDEKIISGNNNKFLLEQDNPYIIDFISNSDNTVVNYEIPYQISIHETYSAKCKIYLTILPCYDSCSRCSVDKSLSSSENHNCLEDKCKEGYYPSPLLVTNCYKIEEKQINWYLDYTIMRFALCDIKCRSCYDSQNDNCLTCYDINDKPDLAYLYQEQCFDQCPEGTYAEKQTEGYYICKSCYINCKTCSDKGNSNNMECDSCFENNIRYQKNCYVEYNSEEKTFYKPESDTQITSCHELLDYYIEENTYECISQMPNTGYYLVNEITGLFAKCHLDCKTCSQKYNDISTNCDECSNENYYLLNGNCIQTCPEGYYPTVFNSIKICKKCYKNCMACDQGEIYNNLLKLTNMNCLKCKKEEDPNDSNNLIENKIQIEGNCFPIITYTQEKIIFDITELNIEQTQQSCLDYGKVIIYGEYQCEEKQDNYYYVLNNDENTGVVKKCDIACSSCNGDKDILVGDTNCINCAEGYYKTQDSNTNCLLESQIPVNYFKNDADNIFYKCYTYCNKCTEYYNSENDNMNCIECINDYYFVYQTNNCYDISFTENNDYFLSERDNKFHKCYFSCLKCTQLELDEYHHNCDECINNYYFEYNTNNCYDFSLLEKGYYFDNFTINQEINEKPVFKKCYEKCKTCNNTLIGDNMNCIECKENYYKKNGTNNCYNEELIEQGYFLNNEIFYPCEENCKTCSNSKTIINGIESNNCLSCDNTIKNLYLVSDLNNCEPESYKENGYYLKETDSDIKIFYKCYISCSLCDQGKESDNHNCLKCKEDFYPLKNDPNIKNCYNAEEMIPQGYSLIRNYWTICHENCDDCNISPTYNSKNILINQNCISCYGDLHLVYGTSNCYSDSILSLGYYLDDNDSQYHKCDIQCKTCDKYSTAQNPKCTECNIDMGYYLAFNKPLTNCYNRTTIDTNKYILSTIENITTGEITRKWMMCYSTCKTCNDYGNNIDNKCITCISHYYLIYDTSNCIQIDQARNNGYYLNTTYNQFVKCDKACLTCTAGLIGDNTNCIKCNEKFGYYPKKGKSSAYCYNKETIDEGYFLNNLETPFQWEECYEYCASCEYKGNSKKMGCLSCKENVFNEEYNKTVYLRLSKTNCNIGCPNNLFLTKDLRCLPSCLNGTYEFIPNVTCVDTCPENYVVNEERTRCVFSTFSGVDSATEFIDIIFQNITNFVDPDTVINGSNFKAQIIASNDIDPVEQIKNGISGLDLGDCIEILKTSYDIPDNEDLIVIEIETTEDKEKNKGLNREVDCIDLGKNVKLSICDMSGNILDMSFCSNDITVMKYIGDVDDIDINTAMEYADQGIDVFNTQDAFFNERCSKVNSDKDIVLGDRRTDIFQNVSFCGDECAYNGMDFNLMIAKCSCDPSNIQEEEDDYDLDDSEENNKKGITLNDLANSFTSEIFSFNFDVIKCYNLVFDSDIIKRNQGFFVNVIMVGLQIIFLFYFLIKRLKPIRNYMLVFEPFDPRVDPPNPPKSSNNIKRGNSDMNIKNKKIFYSHLFDGESGKNDKEKEIKKSLYLNHLLNKSKFRNTESDKKINKIEDDVLVVHYEDDEDNEESDSNSSNNNSKSKSYNSDSNSESHNKKNKTKKIFNNNNNTIYNERYRNKKLNSYHIFSKETIIPEYPKNGRNKEKDKEKENDIFQMQTLTLESNDFSPKNVQFSDLRNIVLFNNNNIQNKKEKEKIKIMDENEIEDKKSIEYLDLEIKNKNLKKNKKGLKHYIKNNRNKNKNKNVNILSSKISLFSEDRNKKRKSTENNSVKYYRRNKPHDSYHKNEFNLNTNQKTEEEMNQKEKKEKLGNMRLKYKKVNYSYTNEDFNNMKFEEAINLDTRSFYRIFVSYLLEEHIIFNTFCTDVYLELRAIKLSFLVFGYEINFFLNAFFYTDEYISDTYHNDGVLDFFSSLPKSIYSFIVTLVISNLLKMLSSSKKQLLNIIKEKDDKKEFLIALGIELSKFKRKIIWYFIIVFILGIFFCYYVSAFCAVYQHSQSFWLIGCLESCALDFVTPFFICLILSTLRYLGLKRRNKCAYNTAKYLGILI